MEDLPYQVEYAKTGRAGCKGCKANIGKDTLRVARMVKSPFHDGKMPFWFHQECFFKKAWPSTEGDMAGFEKLRYEDQESLRKMMANGSSPVAATVVTAATGKTAKKRAAQKDEPKPAASNEEFFIEYAKTDRSVCRGCETKIVKHDVRVKKMCYDSENALKYGAESHWYHLDCFAKLRRELGWFAAGDQLPGYENIFEQDKTSVVTALPAIAVEDVTDAKVAKMEMKPGSAVDAKLEETLIAQNKEYFEFRDNVNANLNKKQMATILEHNHQEVPEGLNAILDALADVLTFGALERCSACNGQYVFNKSTYMCNGNIDEWTKCEAMLKEPPRTPASIPAEFNIYVYPFLNRQYKTVARALKYVPPTVLDVKKETKQEPKIKRDKPVLDEMEFFALGRISKSRLELKTAIQKLGGKLSTKLHARLAAVISSEKEVSKMNYTMADVKAMGIQVIKDSFVDELGSSDIVEYIRTRSICDWGTDPAKRIFDDEVKPKTVTLQLCNNGTLVDPAANMGSQSQVLIEDKITYSVVLSKTEIQADKNSFYKMQIIQSHINSQYVLFRRWGRIGTKNSNKKIDWYHNTKDAIKIFKEVYLEQTGSPFGSANQPKIPGRYYALEMDFGGDDIFLEESTVPSELEPRVQNLIKLLFDAGAMRNVMREFDLDTEKMPLGKLSKKQLLEALTVLTRISEYVRDGATNAQFVGLSNKFFTLIPHDFGAERPPIINTVDMVNAKTEMIQSLIEMEVAYSMLKMAPGDADSNPIDVQYKKQNTELKTLARDSEEFALLKQYVENTHSKLHSFYDLEIQDIFTVKRQDERQRYAPFQTLHNRKLLWHGSRLTNFAGILSNGLKIAPPEAPSTGYMFGKGIYFADMVSKSANYCCTNHSTGNKPGLMLLCEVALGDMLECKTSKYVTQLPAGKHSTKGLGATAPDPNQSHIRADGVEIPLGHPVKDSRGEFALLHNEYIVYDVAQVNVQYLFRMKFKHSY